MGKKMFKGLFGFLLLVSVSVAAQDIPLNVVGNPGSVPEQMDMNRLRSVLKGEQLRWDNGIAVKIALMKTNTPVGSYTCRRVYNMSANDLNKYFLAQVFQGKVKAPMFFTSESELESYVARTPGAIGVLQNTSEGEVNILLIDGKKQL